MSSNASDAGHRKSFRSPGVNADFIREQISGETNETLQKKIGRFLKSYIVVNLMGCVVAADSFLTCAAVDARAASTDLPYVYFLLSKLCLGLYTAELLLSIFARGLDVCKDWLGVIDTIIVLCGWAEVIVTAAMHADRGLPLGLLRIFRLLRIVRTVKLLRRVRMFKELYKLIKMMLCSKPMNCLTFWSFWTNACLFLGCSGK